VATSPTSTLINAKTRSAIGTATGWLALAFWNALIAAIFGVLTVVLVLGLNFIVFAVWVGTLLIRVRRQNSSQAIVTAAVQGAVMVFIVIAAHYAPVKTTERFLDREIQIPTTRMTLAELEGERDGPLPTWRPFSLWIWAPEDEKQNEVAFPATHITLRQFVDAVEAQSTLRHRFSHCGNDSTILWGGDCSFGLHLRRPNPTP